MWDRAPYGALSAGLKVRNVHIAAQIGTQPKVDATKAWRMPLMRAAL
jgi:hypothetical protein